MPQPPQFCESVAVSTHCVPQAVCPGHVFPAPPVPFPPPPPPEPMLEQAPSRASIKSEPNPKPRATVSMAENCSGGRKIATQNEAEAQQPINQDLKGNQGNTTPVISHQTTTAFHPACTIMPG
jgi:hypothetical protein